MPGCGSHLCFTGLEPAVGLCPALWTVDRTSSVSCRYFPSFYNGTKLYCLVTEAHGPKWLAESCGPFDIPRMSCTHTHPFNGPLFGTTRVSRYQKCKTNLDFTEARDSEWQWHQLGHMQVCTSLQTNTYTYIQIYIAPKIMRTNLRC